MQHSELFKKNPRQIPAWILHPSDQIAESHGSDSGEKIVIF